MPLGALSGVPFSIHARTRVCWRRMFLLGNRLTRSSWLRHRVGSVVTLDARAGGKRCESGSLRREGTRPG